MPGISNIKTNSYLSGFISGFTYAFDGFTFLKRDREMKGRNNPFLSLENLINNVKICKKLESIRIVSFHILLYYSY